MKRLAVLLCGLCLPSLICAESPRPWSDETLRYTVNWPSGLSLGEAQWTVKRGPDAGFALAFLLDASIPAFSVTERYRSLTNASFCSLELEKTATRGSRKTQETTVFDPQSGKATRTTDKGGKAELASGPCGHDALAFVMYLRKELQAGRVPAESTLYFGAPYQVRLQYGGTPTVPVNDTPTIVDRLVANIKGPASDHTIELFFSREPSRPLVLVRVPLALGNFSMELTR